MPSKRFLVALSFPGEHRSYALELAESLTEKLGKDSVFYDNWYEDELSSPNLHTYLQDIYCLDSHLVVPFLCADYERKQWCRLEWRFIMNFLMNRQDKDIMPCRFDDANIPGFLNSIDGYLDLRKHTAQETAGLILKRLQKNGYWQEESIFKKFISYLEDKTAETTLKTAPPIDEQKPIDEEIENYQNKISNEINQLLDKQPKLKDSLKKQILEMETGMTEDMDVASYLVKKNF